MTALSADGLTRRFGALVPVNDLTFEVPVGGWSVSWGRTDRGSQQHLRTVEVERGLPRPGDFLFTTSTGLPLNYRNVSVRGLDKAADAANLNPVGKPRLTFHDLRHTFGSHLALSGIDPVAVQRQMGHARASITMDVYVHEFDSAAAASS